MKRFGVGVAYRDCAIMVNYMLYAEEGFRKAKLVKFNELVLTKYKESMEDISVSLDELVKKAEEKSISKGILKKADENAKKLIENFLKGTFEIDGYKIKVFFKED